MGERKTRTDEDIREAVQKWVQDPASAKRRYGHISDWDVSRVTDMSKLFYFRKDFNEDLSRWQTGNVMNMSMMFYMASSFTSDLSKWQTGKVTDMTYMFCGAESFNSDLSEWQTGNVTDMFEMFEGAAALQQRPQWYTRWEEEQLL